MIPNMADYIFDNREIITVLSTLLSVYVFIHSYCLTNIYISLMIKYEEFLLITVMSGNDVGFAAV